MCTLDNLVKHFLYSLVQKKVTVLLLAWPAWVGCDWAELLNEPGTNFLLNPVQRKVFQ